MKYLPSMMLLVLVLLCIVYTKPGVDVNPTKILDNITLEETLFNITDNTFPYTSFYNNEVTIKGTVLNIVHASVYSSMIFINTFFPIAVYVASGEWATTIIKICGTCFILIICLKLIDIVKIFIALYFFFKEKKKYKERLVE